MLRPVNVFTPGKLPLSETNVYSPRTRERAQERFGKALERGLVPLVFGEYGVGKTSLARHSIRGSEQAGKLVNVESVAGRSMAEIFQQCLENIGYTVARKKVTSTGKAESHDQSGTAKVGVVWAEAMVASKRTKSSTEGSSIEEELVVTSPTNSKVLQLCESHGLVLLIDELHRASDQFSLELADFLKAYGNANCRNFKVVLLGTASEATRLVSIDPGIDRLIQEIHLKAMDVSEAGFIVEEGMRSLAINIDARNVTKLVNVSVGSPNILQYLCLECAESAWERSPRVVEYGNINDALRDYVESREARLYRSYMAAIENVGERRYRKQILRAMAECEDEYVTMEQIRSGVSSYLGEDVPSTALSGPLRDLKQSRFGPVLQDVERPDSSERLSNYTVFIDPSLKAFIRLIVRKEELEASSG